VEGKVKYILIGICLVGPTWLWHSCNQPGPQKAEASFRLESKEEKHQLIKSIEAEIDLVKSRIENYRNELDEESKSYSEEVRQLVKQRVDDLKNEKRNLKDHLVKVRNSDYNHWENNKKDLQSAFNGIQERVGQVGEEVKSLFEDSN
jgi:predicted  nucleic acid-binding Zn-ribbon protein